MYKVKSKNDIIYTFIGTYINIFINFLNFTHFY